MKAAYLEGNAGAKGEIKGQARVGGMRNARK
jgi:hypothetical protein